MPRPSGDLGQRLFTCIYYYNYYLEWCNKVPWTPISPYLHFLPLIYHPHLEKTQGSEELWKIVIHQPSTCTSRRMFKRTYLHDPPLSPSKRNNSSEQRIHSIPPPTPQISTQPPKRHSKYRCWTCNGEDVHSVPIESTPPKMNHLVCAEMILHILQVHGLTLGDVIMMVLDHEMPFSWSTIESLKHFVQGCTKRNHPCSILSSLCLSKQQIWTFISTASQFCHPSQWPSASPRTWWEKKHLLWAARLFCGPVHGAYQTWDG